MDALDTQHTLPGSREAVEAWARDLADQVSKVMQCFPEADRDNVRHTLILLQIPPLERLGRSLLRGSPNTHRR
jgi:hypothetical protein